MISKAIRVCACVALVALWAAIPGCTSRSITITSSPEGAEVSINRRVIGRTPVRVGFTHYGTYRIELRLDKYDTLVKEETVNAPAYGYDPVSFFTDNAIPARLNDEIYVHYVLKKSGEVADRSALLQRADLARQGQYTDRNGNSGSVAYSVPPKTPAAPTAGTAGTAGATGTTGTPGEPAVTPPANDSQIKPIDVQEPEGAKLNKELNKDAPPPAPEKKPEAPKTEPKDPKTPATPPRAPKNEELLFDKPATPKADAPKGDAPKSADPKTDPKSAPATK
jgi:hypothetical protein